MTSHPQYNDLRAVEIRNSIKKNAFHERTDGNVGRMYFWFVKFEDVLRRLTEEITAEFQRIPDTRTTVRVFPSFIVPEMTELKR